MLLRLLAVVQARCKSTFGYVLEVDLLLAGHWLALANKMARIAWAVMAHKTKLQPGLKGMAASSLIKMNA